jgi:lactoylglutathione lyase
MNPIFTRIDCISLPVPSIDEGISFYGKALGHEVLWRHDTAVGLKLPESNAELVLHTENRPHEVDWKVDSVPDAVKRFVEAGGELIAGPFEIRIGLCAVLRDPWKNPIVVLDTSKGLLKINDEKKVVDN